MVALPEYSFATLGLVAGVSSLLGWTFAQLLGKTEKSITIVALAGLFIIGLPTIALFAFPALYGISFIAIWPFALMLTAESLFLISQQSTDARKTSRLSAIVLTSIYTLITYAMGMAVSLIDAGFLSLRQNLIPFLLDLPNNIGAIVDIADTTLSSGDAFGLVSATLLGIATTVAVIALVHFTAEKLKQTKQ